MTANTDEFSPTFDAHWEGLYAAGQHLNRWPFDHVISFLKRGSSRLGYETLSPLRVLEVGFGAGNNLIAAATEGFTVAGIDASHSAVEFARTRFAAEGQTGELIVGDFVELPWDDEHFDFVVDRLALTNSTPSGIRRAIAEVHRVLRTGGLFQFNVLGVGPETDGDELRDGCVHRTELRGSLTGIGGVTFFDEAGVRSQFPDAEWQLEALQEVVTRGLVEANPFQPNEIQCEWRAVVRKKGLVAD